MNEAWLAVRSLYYLVVPGYIISGPVLARIGILERIVFSLVLSPSLLLGVRFLLRLSVFSDVVSGYALVAMIAIACCLIYAWHR